MNVIVWLLQSAGVQRHFVIRVNNPPHLPLMIEDTEVNGPRGIPCISVAFYTERNGRFACRPEMLFEVYNRRYSIQLRPFYYRDDFEPIEGYAVFYTGRILVVDTAFLRFQENFAAQWNEKLEALGYEDAFHKSRKSSARQANAANTFSRPTDAMIQSQAGKRENGDHSRNEIQRTPKRR